MVFTKDGVAKVWLHEDVFSEKPLLPLESEEAERRYVDSFLKVMREHIFNLQLPVCASSVSDLRRQLRRLAMDYRQNQKQSIKKIQIKLLPSVHGSKCE